MPLVVFDSRLINVKPSDFRARVIEKVYLSIFLNCFSGSTIIG